MTSYPAPPPTSGAPLASPPAAKDTSNTAPPELPSAAWPWLVGIVAIVALGLQTWALLGLLTAGRLESDFQAKVVAWETANKNRQEAIDILNSIEKQINANVDQLREQSSLLQGTIDSMQKQRDQLVETTTSQAKTLEALQSTRQGLQSQIESLRSELGDVNTKKQETELAIKAAEGDKSQIDAQNVQLIDQGKQVRVTLAELETAAAAAEAKVETQAKLLDKSTAELKAMETRVAQYDTFLQTKLAAAADFKLQQAKATETAKELDATTTELERQTMAAAKAAADLAALKKQMTDLAASREKESTELTAIQTDVQKAEANLADLRKKEQQLAQQVVVMTGTMNAAVMDATKSLSSLTETAASTIREMTEKAVEVRRAVNEIRVPEIKPDLPAAGVANEEPAETTPPTPPEDGAPE